MADASLKVEYRQYQFLKKLFQVLQRAFQNPEHTSENGFGRWLQNIQHWDQLHHKYRLLPNHPDPEGVTGVELVRMLEETLHVTQELAESVARDLYNSIEEFLSSDHDEEPLTSVTVTYNENQNEGQIIVGEFKTPRCHRVSCLAKNFGINETALVCLRYNQLSKFRGGESGMSVTGLNALHDVGQVRFEGFSSPLNCRLLGQDGVSFCSLFQDTDAAFGSLGNFFRIRLTDYPGGWSLGPPFVEPVLNDTATKVVRTLDETEPGKFWFFVTMPNWEDNPGWQTLEQSQHKVARFDFDKKQFWQQDDYGAIYHPNAKYCVFALGQLPDEVDLVELRNRICVDDEATVRDDWLEACDVEV